MDVLVEFAPLAAFVAGAGATLLAARYRNRPPSGAKRCAVYDDGKHRLDRMDRDSKGWRCKCGAGQGTK